MGYQYRDDNVPGFIYLIEAVGYHGMFPGCYLKRCKIGLSRDVDRRLSEFEANQPPCDVRLIKSVYVTDMARAEGELHRWYRSSNVKLARSKEWFDLYPWQIEIIKQQMLGFQAEKEPVLKFKYLVATALVVAGLSATVVGGLRQDLRGRLPQQFIKK